MQGDVAQVLLHGRILGVEFVTDIQLSVAISLLH